MEIDMKYSNDDLIGLLKFYSAIFSVVGFIFLIKLF